MLRPSSNRRRPRFAFRVSRFTHRPIILAFLALASCAFIAVGSGLITPSGLSQAQAEFADPAFEALWNRTDGLVASEAVKRPWVWGPAPGVAMFEPFEGLPGNRHSVQFFDKGRMEINDPNGDKNDPFYVTNGRLAIELISGQIQTGLESFQNRPPATINLASDVDDPSAPTYQSFNGVSNLPGTGDDRRADDETGQIVRTAIDRQGNTQPWPGDHPDYGVKIARYEPETGHNIPDVFWDYLNQQGNIVQDGAQVQGPLFFPWFGVTGYPISEPYWSYVKVEGKYTDVLIQAYERRVLTFVPHLPSPFKVQMGNIGQHYYDWRYGEVVQNTPQPVVATPTSPALPPKANLTIDEIHYRASVIDINGNYCVITNRGERDQSMDGYILDSPKWSHVDRYVFPNGIVIPPGGTIRLRSGPGLSTSADIFMARTTVMWDGQPYDLAILYDNYGREVYNFFPAGDVGVPPTPPPPGSTPAATPTSSGGTSDPTKVPGTSVPPTPQETQPPGASSPTPTTSGNASPTPTGIPANCSNRITNGNFEAGRTTWIEFSSGGYEIITTTFPYEGAYSAILGGYSNATEIMSQTVSISADAGTAELSYQRYVASDDPGSTANDIMYVEVRNESGAVLTILETLTNQSPRGAWGRSSFSLIAYKGQTVRIHFRAITNATEDTAFAVDNVVLLVCP